MFWHTAFFAGSLGVWQFPMTIQAFKICRKFHNVRIENSTISPHLKKFTFCGALLCPFLVALCFKTSYLEKRLMQQYLALLERVLHEGDEKTDRTGTGTLSVFGHQMRFDLGVGFPLLTTRRLSFETVTRELLRFLTGDAKATTRR